MSHQLSRRHFLLRSIEGAAAVSLFQRAVAPAPEPSRPLRLGLVGLGARGSRFAQMAVAPHAELAAICDRNPSALDAVLQSRPGIPAFGEIGSMLAGRPLDAVVIAAPAGLELGEQALASGKGVFLASTTATDFRRAAHLGEMAGRRGLDLAVAPSDLAWDTAELDAILASAGALSPGLVKLSLTSAAPHSWDVLHNAANLISAYAPRRAFAVQARTPRGSSQAATFLFADPEWQIDIEAGTAPGLEAGRLLIRADLPIGGRRVNLSIDSIVKSHTGSASIEEVPAFAGFVTSANSGRTSGLSPLTAHALRVIGYTGLLTDSLSSGGRA